MLYMTQFYICCKNCKEQSIGCHGICEKYLEATRKHEEEKRRIAESRQREAVYWGYKHDRERVVRR